ncbi:hypothetical protein RB595_006151 [Gaeumannomyces hyphopodioides]
MAIRRLKAWLLTATLICIVLYFTRERSHYTLPKAARPGPAAAVAPADAASNTGPPRPRTTFAAMKLPQAPGAKVNSLAHKLTWADDFLPHLSAVTKLPGITLAQAKRSCTWGPADKVDFQFDDKADWVAKDRPEDEVEAKRREWRQFVREGMIPYGAVQHRFTNQRGLVVLAGNQDTFKRVGLMLRALQRLKSRVAVEVHYYGEAEMTEQHRQALSTVWPRMFFNDLSSPDNILLVQKDRPFINYQLKTAALVNSRFQEPLLVDADNIPVLDPDELWASAAYEQYGTVFWPDIARTYPQDPAWAITNTECRMDEYELESGQLLVDKRRYWYHLQLAAWWATEQGAYWDAILLGDKDLFRFAWHALRTDYGRPRRWLASVGTLNKGFYCGHSFAQHHPDDARVAFLHGGLVKTVDLQVMRWNRDTQGGYYRHYKRAPSDEDPGVSVNVGIKFDGADYMDAPKGAGFRAAMCTDMYDVEARDLNELIPMWEKTFGEIGGYWQLATDDGQGGKPI